MKHTNTASSLHRCRKALVACLTFACAGSALALNGPPGEFDPSFSGGKVVTDFSNAVDLIRAIAPMNDGRFVAAGGAIGPNASGPGSSPNLAVARYLPDGRLDDTFGTNGKFQFDLGGGTDDVYGLKVLPDGSVLVSGELSPQAHSDFFVMKLRPNGTADTTFGASNGAGARTGFVRLDVVGPGTHDEGRVLAVQRDGKIIVAGNTFKPAGGFSYRRVTVARFTADGQLDTTFGESDGAGGRRGYVVAGNQFAAQPQTSDYVTSIAMTQSGALPADDKITVSGYTDSSNNGFLVRYTSDGQPDLTFGGGTGHALTSYSSSGGVARGLSDIMGARIDNAGRYVVVGNGGDRGFAFVRFLSNGAQDMTFGTNASGRTLVKVSSVSNYDEPSAIALQGNGKIVASGYATTVVPGGTAHNDFFVVRLDANGVADPTFGDGQGRKVASIATEKDQSFAIAVEPSGNLLVGGYVQRAGAAQTDFAVARLFGDPDRIFADGFQAAF